jgi:hypothetical protein
VERTKKLEKTEFPVKMHVREYRLERVFVRVSREQQIERSDILRARQATTKKTLVNKDVD